VLLRRAVNRCARGEPEMKRGKRGEVAFFLSGSEDMLQ